VESTVFTQVADGNGGFHAGVAERTAVPGGGGLAGSVQWPYW